MVKQCVTYYTVIIDVVHVANIEVCINLTLMMKKWFLHDLNYLLQNQNCLAIHTLCWQFPFRLHTNLVPLWKLPIRPLRYRFLDDCASPTDSERVSFVRQPFVVTRPVCRPNYQQDVPI